VRQGDIHGWPLQVSASNQLMDVADARARSLSQQGARCRRCAAGASCCEMVPMHVVGWMPGQCAMPFIWCACTLDERCRDSVCTALCWCVAKRLTGTGTGTGLSMYLSTSRSTGLQDTHTNHASVSHMGAHCLCSCTCQHQIMAVIHLPVASRRCRFRLQLMSQCTSNMASCSCVCSWCIAKWFNCNCICHMLAVTQVKIESRVVLYRAGWCCCCGTHALHPTGEGHPEPLHPELVCAAPCSTRQAAYLSTGMGTGTGGPGTWLGQWQGTNMAREHMSAQLCIECKRTLGFKAST
jgi:hypothetical protein